MSYVLLICNEDFSVILVFTLFLYPFFTVGKSHQLSLAGLRADRAEVICLSDTIFYTIKSPDIIYVFLSTTWLLPPALWETVLLTFNIIWKSGKTYLCPGRSLYCHIRLNGLETPCAFAVLDLVLLLKSWRGNGKAGEEDKLTALLQPQASWHNLATHLGNPEGLKRWKYQLLVLKGQSEQQE